MEIVVDVSLVIAVLSVLMVDAVSVFVAQTDCAPE